MVRKTTLKKNNVPVPPSFATSPVSPVIPRKFRFRWIIVGLVVLLIVLATANKGWVVAAVVDGRPIFSWQLHQMLRSRYGEQTLEGMIGETLIQREAKKSDVSITGSDLEKKQKEILTSLGTEVSLSDFLKFQGLTEGDFNQQLKIQLTVERLLTKDLSITEQDIDNYIATNRATLTATDPGALREEAKKAIINNVVSEKLQTWFMELRQKSKVLKFL